MFDSKFLKKNAFILSSKLFFNKSMLNDVNVETY